MLGPHVSKSGENAEKDPVVTRTTQNLDNPVFCQSSGDPCPCIVSVAFSLILLPLEKLFGVGLQLCGALEKHAVLPSCSLQL